MNIKRQILNRVNADATLLALLGNGANSVFPNVSADPAADSSAPFIVLRMGALSDMDGIVSRQFWTWYIYDTPDSAGWGYWRIDRIVERLKTLFDGYESFTTDAWGRVAFDGAGEEQTDDDWHKLVKWARFSATRI